MASSPFEILQRQAEHTVRAQVQKETSRVRRELSLVTQVQQMSSQAGQALSHGMDRVLKSRRPQQQAGELAEEDAAGGKPVICADGYRRRSPVQRYRRPRDGRTGRKIIKWVIVGVLAVLLVLTVWKGGLLHL